MISFIKTLMLVCSGIMCVSLWTVFVHAEEPVILSEPQEEEIKIDDTTFPDENFRNLVLDKFDTDHSESLSMEERLQVEYIYCNDQEISDLTGVGYFSELMILKCEQNNIAELDLRQNTALDTVFCYENQITNINLSGCPNLEILSCSDNLFTSLDLSNNPELKWIYCNDNPSLQSLNVRNCSKVTILDCYRCALTELDVSDCTSLKELICFSNKLESLDISKCTELSFLSTGYNDLNSLDVSQNTKLKTLGAQANNISTLDIRNNDQLIELYKTGEKRENEYEGKKYIYYVKQGTSDAFGFDEGVELIYEKKGKVQDVFDDVNEGDWFVSFVQYVYDNDLMTGKGTNTFAPNTPIRREEFTQILYNHMGKPEVTIDNPYTDVKDAWYKNSVLWAKENNIANGKVRDEKVVFDVGKDITREELALMLYKYAKLRNYNLERTEGVCEEYKDGSKVSSWAKEAMEWAVSQGIITGKGGKGAEKSEMRIDPQGNATRAECACMMTKLLKKN